jgi:hypothetical protein
MLKRLALAVIIPFLLLLAAAPYHPAQAKHHFHFFVGRPYVYPYGYTYPYAYPYYNNYPYGDPFWSPYYGYGWGGWNRHEWHEHHEHHHEHHRHH